MGLSPANSGANGAEIRMAVALRRAGDEFMRLFEAFIATGASKIYVIRPSHEAHGARLAAADDFHRRCCMAVVPMLFARPALRCDAPGQAAIGDGG
jgi:hypothetical protein